MSWLRFRGTEDCAVAGLALEILVEVDCDASSADKATARGQVLVGVLRAWGATNADVSGKACKMLASLFVRDHYPYVPNVLLDVLPTSSRDENGTPSAVR